MDVAEIIERLRLFPQDALVRYSDYGLFVITLGKWWPDGNQSWEIRWDMPPLPDFNGPFSTERPNT